MCLVYLIGIIIIANKNIRSPYEYAKAKYCNLGEEILCEEYEPNKYVLFAFEADNCISCLVLEKKIFGLKIKDYNTYYINTGINGLRYSSYNKGNSWVYWTVVWDKAAQKVIVDGKSLHLRNTIYDFKIAYLLGDGKINTIQPEYSIE